jgi:hypothetical protein
LEKKRAVKDMARSMLAQEDGLNSVRNLKSARH